MKLKLKFKKIFTANIMLVVSTCLFAQTNVENFDYPESTLLTDASIGFEIKASTPSISVVSPGLEYSGLAVSGIGNAAHIAISEDTDTDPNTYGPERIAKKPFFSSSVNSGTVYLSFLGNITTTIGGDYNNFFIAVSDYLSQSLRGRVMAKDDGSGNLIFGFTKGYSTDINWTTDLYNYNETYLFVVKYEFVAGDNNDVASLFIFEQGGDGVPFTEPSTPTLIPNDGSGSDLSNIKILHLRQRKVEAVVDGLSLGMSWSDVLAETLNLESFVSNQRSVKIFQAEDGNLVIDVLGPHLDGDHMVSIFNLNGQLLLKQNTNNQNRFTLDTKSQLQKGAYILGINGSSGNYFKKFIFVN